MLKTRRTFLAATGASVAASACASQAGTPDEAPSHRDTLRIKDDLIERSRASNAALMAGDIDRYRSLITFADDFTLMSPFGGPPSYGRDMTSEAWDRMGRFFRNGTFSQEVVETYVTEEMAVLAIIERCHVEVGGLPAQDWPLRVTLVYRREGSQWRLAHRHADPLVAGVSHATAAALARGAIR